MSRKDQQLFLSCLVNSFFSFCCVSNWVWSTVLHHGERILQEPPGVLARVGGLHGLAALRYARPPFNCMKLDADAAQVMILVLWDRFW
jgi:hypothetical protein